MDRYVVYGNPISHSWSPVIHQEFARQAGIEIEYTKCLVETDFPGVVRSFFSEGGKGANVTMPFKEEAMRTVEVLTQRARMAGAVNTLYIREGKLTGDNTDGVGFVTDIQRQYSHLKDSRVLLIGAGGAVRGVISPLFDAGVSSIKIANRTESKAQILADEFSTFGDVVASNLDDLSSNAFDVIVNCTSSSVHGELPNISEEVFKGAQFAYDMYYQRDSTVFMKFAVQNNPQISTSDGLGMLIGQAAESFRMWTDVAPDIDATAKLMKEKMFG